MSVTETKRAIHQAIEAFASGDLSANALALFNTLGYRSELKQALRKRTYAEFAEYFVQNGKRFSEENACTHKWQSVDLLFQLTTEQLTKQDNLFKNEKVDRTIIESYLFFAIELKPKGKDQAWTRTDLSHITREVNRLFAMPVMILFKHGDTLTLAIIDRRLHKREEGKDVLEKVTLIKDIRTSAPHRAHVEILFDLSLDELRHKHGFTNFPQLHEAWRKTLDIKELNKRFFRELSNWYFHAVEVTKWPADAEGDKEKRNAINTIRLITRLMFVWFLREKDLVPDALFDPKALKKILRGDVKEKSLYYKAILQNLFFATLNTEMGKRRFRIEADRSQSKHYFIHNVFRYERCFVDPKGTLKQLFDPIPFLNGGLFECLDKQVEQKGKLVPVRIDGFSDRDDNPLHVPDKLFFDPEGEEWDFSEVYGSKKARKEKVRGLIDILGSYKFTITENTPIEEEVALDPELLGKVFENLLANYNPETKTTARKQTGSFYTPREIVNYMVDESLIAYLKTELGEKADTEERLRQLLSYSEDPHQFSKAETEKLITAIDTCKILDPACGSGAFPMGVLHKLVHVLHKLDPQNKQWKERQIEKAAQLDDADIRERTIADIEDAFEHNALDYGRKLYLIENGIYGVDIQPIAMQIAKLRFFISLIVDQKARPYDAAKSKEDNRGVRALPNLETKFVAANTLMRLHAEKRDLFTNPDIDDKKARLKRVRHDYFEARTPQRKEKCRQQDKKLREDLAELLMLNHEFQPKEAKMLAAWDPYDQNASAPFFDPEWMFDTREGFDVVIGNPPYISSKDFDKKDMQFFIEHYETAQYQLDLYVFFIEVAVRLLGPNGVISYITPNSWLKNMTFSELRRFLLDNVAFKDIVPNMPAVFEAAAVDTAVFIALKSKSKSEFAVKQFVDGEARVKHFIDQKRFRKNERFVFNVEADDAANRVIEKVREKSARLDSIADITRGVNPYDQARGHTPEMVENRVFHADKKKNKTYRPELKGKHVHCFGYSWDAGEYISYGDWLAAPREWKYFTGPRIIMRQVLGTRLACTIIEEDFVIDQSVFIAKPHESHIKAIRAIQGVLASSLLVFYFRYVANEFDALFPKIKIGEFRELPVLIPPAKVKAQLEKLVEKRLGLEAGPKAEAVEREIDQVVYGLYGLTEEEIKIVEGSGKRKDQKISESDTSATLSASEQMIEEGDGDGEPVKRKRGRPRKSAS